LTPPLAGSDGSGPRCISHYRRRFSVQEKDTKEWPRLTKKLALCKETVRVLTDKELDAVGGGAGTHNCTGTCACGGTCGNFRSTCPPP
jgi:hypothetical protein